MPDRNNDMVPCANPECGHRKIHHHPRAGVCMASDRGEFCPCDEYEYPLEREAATCGAVLTFERGSAIVCGAPIVERFMEMAGCALGHWTRLPTPEPEPEADVERAGGLRAGVRPNLGSPEISHALKDAEPFTSALAPMIEPRMRRDLLDPFHAAEPGPMTEDRFDALAREAATEEERCICGYIRASHGRRGMPACPEFRPDPFAGEAIQFVHDAVDVAFEKRRRNLLAADKRNPEGE